MGVGEARGKARDRWQARGGSRLEAFCWCVAGVDEPAEGRPYQQAVGSAVKVSGALSDSY